VKVVFVVVLVVVVVVLVVVVVVIEPGTPKSAGTIEVLVDVPTDVALAAPVVEDIVERD
jgi:hypothetical protein